MQLCCICHINNTEKTVFWNQTNVSNCHFINNQFAVLWQWRQGDSFPWQWRQGDSFPSCFLPRLRFCFRNLRGIWRRRFLLLILLCNWNIWRRLFSSQDIIKNILSFLVLYDYAFKRIPFLCRWSFRLHYIIKNIIDLFCSCANNFFCFIFSLVEICHNIIDFLFWLWMWFIRFFCSCTSSFLRLLLFI